MAQIAAGTALFNAEKEAYPHKDKIRDRFNNRLDNGKCREKLNALLKQLGTSETIDGIAKEVLSSKTGLQITKSAVPVGASAAARFNFTIGDRRSIIFNNTRDYSNEVESFNRDSFDLIHEILHIANKNNGEYLHEDIVDAIVRMGETTVPIREALDPVC